MLYLENLVKNYGGFRAVDHLSLHVPKGDLFGFVGPNGAGKTTTIRMLCGLLKPDYGSIYIGGYELRRQSEAVRRCIGYVPDFFGVYDNLKVSEYMEFYGSIYGIDDSEVRKMTRDLLELVNLSGSEDVYVDGLSRGMKQRLCVARALLHNPELLVLDEPSSGLDPRARVEMKELLMNLNSMGKTIIISSHILADIAEMCTSMGIMNRGRLVTAGRMEDILSMGKNEHHVVIAIRSDMDEAARHMQEMPEIHVVSRRENEIVIDFEGTDEELNRMIGGLMTSGVLVGGFQREESNLETLFMQLTSGAIVPPQNASGPVNGQPMGQPMGNPGMGQPMGGPGMDQPMGNPGMGQPMGGPAMGQPMGGPGMGQLMGDPGMGQPMGGPGMGQPMGDPGMGQPMGGPAMGQPMGDPGMGQPMGPGAMIPPAAEQVPPIPQDMGAMPKDSGTPIYSGSSNVSDTGSENANAGSGQNGEA
ncbi:MAG: ATP-binding cassette domain-containing protein [Lachnospiraceae bacterium]|nr:ATP-binding cassette domain-containing protein [Lachnospiraceae bacterium]